MERLIRIHEKNYWLQLQKLDLVSLQNFVGVENLNSIATNLHVAECHGSLEKNQHMVDSCLEQSQKGGSFENLELGIGEMRIGGNLWGIVEEGSFQ